MNRPPLADGKVRFVGDIVAVVVAETQAQAVDAAETVIVDYDPLPVVVDPEAALADDAPSCSPSTARTSRSRSHFGAADGVLDDADVVVDGPHRQPARRGRADGAATASSSMPGEPAGGSRSDVPTQGPHGVRDELARLARPRAASSVRVIAPAVGGGFGAKAGCYRRVPRRRHGRAARSAGR